MLSYDSVQGLIGKCEQLPQLDVAILNAGIMNFAYKNSPSTKHEESLQVNHLSTALLSILLLPILTRKRRDRHGSPGHITIVGSALGLTAKFSNRNAIPLLPSFSKPDEWTGISSGQEQYSVTKMLLFMLVYQLAKFVKPENVIINLIEPGFTGDTGLARGVGGMLKVAGVLVNKLLARSPKQAA